MIIKHIIGALAVCAGVANASSNVLMSEANDCAFSETCENHDWRVADVADSSDSNLALVFAVKHANVDQLEELLMAVSDPYSPHRGKYLSGDQVRSLTTDRAALQTVVKFLVGYSGVEVDSSSTESFIRVRATKEAAENMLGTQFTRFESEATGNIIYRTPAYFLPEEVATAVDFVAGTVNFPSTTKPSMVHSVGDRTPSINTDGVVTPEVVSKVYNIKDNVCTNPGNSNAFFGSLNQAFSPEDLTQFQTLYGFSDEQVDVTIGPNDYSHCPTSEVDCGEATLDVQYLKTGARNVTTTFWSVPACASCVNEPFVDWLVAVEGASNPPLVHSVSYGDDERDIAEAEKRRFNEEAMKLGVRGLTLLFSSGDDGVAGYKIRNNQSDCGFHPEYPASSPYITSVGGTQGPESGEAEVGCQSDLGGVITTGGGFSNTFDRPAYQKRAVDGYFATIGDDALPPSEQYSHTGRGYPDVAVLAYNFNTILNGVNSGASGTSASAPVMSAIVTLLNDARLNAGLSPLGFLNPTLYALAEGKNGASIFHDVTSGYNNCAAGHDKATLVCCDYAFEAGAGWDPVSGLGSVDFEELKQAVLALP